MDMNISRVVAVTCVLALAFSATTTLAAKGGNKSAGPSILIPYIADANGAFVASVFNSDRERDPAVLAVMEFTDPNGVSRNGIVGVDVYGFISAAGQYGTIFLDSACQNGPYRNMGNPGGGDGVGLEGQFWMFLDMVYVVNDRLYMNASPPNPDPDVIGPILNAAPAWYFDREGTCSQVPFEVPYLGGLILVEDDIYLRYEAPFVFEFQ